MCPLKSHTKFAEIKLTQNNPNKVKDDGSYAFVLPKGKYYLEVITQGYKKTQSEIIFREILMRL